MRMVDLIIKKRQGQELTDEEINGKYLEDIKEYVNKAYTLIYNDSEKCSSITPGYFGGGYNDL